MTLLLHTNRNFPTWVLLVHSNGGFLFSLEEPAPQFCTSIRKTFLPICGCFFGSLKSVFLFRRLRELQTELLVKLSFESNSSLELLKFYGDDCTRKPFHVIEYRFCRGPYDLDFHLRFSVLNPFVGVIG